MNSAKPLSRKKLKAETSHTQITGVSVKLLFSVMYDQQEDPVNFTSDKGEYSYYWITNRKISDSQAAIGTQSISLIL